MIDLMERLFPRSNARLSSNDEGYGSSSAWNGLLSLMKSASGAVVTPDTAMRQATVFACVRVLSETLAQFPRHVYRKTSNGRKQIASDHPLAYVLGVRPNQWQTPFEFVEMMQGHVCLRGNAYALIIPGELGSVTELWPLHPDRVKVERLANGSLRYEVTYANGGMKYYMQDEVFHVRGYTTDGINGLSPIAYARDTVGLNLSAERYGAKFFRNAVRPSGFLKGPAVMRQKDAAAAQQTLMEAYAGEDNHFKPMVLGGALEWQNMGMSNEDAQFIETLTRGDKQIAKIFRMQPHKVGIMDDATFSNIEHQGLEFVGDTMLPWCRRWEEAIARDLIVDNDVYYFRFEFEGLLRADTAARTAFYQSAINNGWMSPNEVRALEDLPPYKGGDELFMQGAMVTVDSIINPPPPPAPPAPPMLPPPAEDDEEDDDDAEEEQANARRMGEMLGRIDQLKASIETATAALAERDKELALADSLTAQQAAASDSLSVDLAAAKAERDQAAAELARAQADLLAIQEGKSDQAREAERLRAIYDNALQSNTDLIRSTLEYLQTFEVAALTKASKRERFAAGLDDFYSKHAARMKNSLEPLFAQRHILGVDAVDADTFIGLHIEDSQNRLLGVMTTSDAQELGDRIDACVSEWGGRAEELIATLTEFENEPAQRDE